METQALAVTSESSPVVFEIEEPGGEDRREVVLLVTGASGRLDDLRVDLQPVKETGRLRFEIGTYEKLEPPPEEPIRIAIPLTCSGGEREGEEVKTVLRATVRLGDGPPQTIEVPLIASVNCALPLSQVLREEYEALKPDWAEKLRQDPVIDSPNAAENDKQAALYAFVHDKAGQGDPLAGLCLSGGGIRSATFNLGVLQGLARIGVLDQFQYLSSVSGGGYISSWLSGWIYRLGGLDKVMPQLQGIKADPVQPEAPTITHLRRYSNYLTPRLGMFSADSWTVAAIVSRNLLLNWSVLVPLLAAFLAIPLLAISQPPAGWQASPGLLFAAALLFGGISLFYMSLLRASAEGKEGREKAPPFLTLGLLPLLIATPLMLMAVRGAWGALGNREMIAGCLIWSVLLPMAAFCLSFLYLRRLRHRASLRWDLLFLLISGLIEAAVYFAMLNLWLPKLLPGPQASPFALRWHLYEILGPAFLLSPLLLGKTAFIALSSAAEDYGFPPELGDADREWWARWSGWILLSSLFWLAAGALVFFSPLLLQTLAAKISAAVAAGSLGSLTSLLGKSANTAAKNSTEGPGLTQRLTLSLAPSLFAVAVALLISAGTQGVLRMVTRGGGAGDPAGAYQGPTVVLVAAIVLLLLIGVAVGRFVNVNRFSLQAMYRNRLVRAYLGASNPKRRPNLFTGFDPKDNLRLHALRDNRPLPVYNMTLNLVAGKELAWQERKAESFTATPLHCGAANLGYRRTQVYGGEHGISLGTAVATSGAAANPNMGVHSSPAVSFIMTIFNARLGAWLGNPGSRGRKTYTRNGPLSSAKLLLDEAFGRTDSQHPYVNLSDGGHFENFGLYELVRRRCRFIVVCDAGGDPKYEFSDLGNAIRKIRIDFGISTDFDDGIHIFPKPDGDPRPGAAYCAIGTVRYDSIDGKGTNGVVIYIKPAICARLSYDVYNYAKASKTFPQESTADQWFSETQFESYRALARAAIREIVRTGPNADEDMDLKQFEANVRRYLALDNPPPAA